MHKRRYVLSCPDVSNNFYIFLCNSRKTGLHLEAYKDRALSNVTTCTKSSNKTQNKTSKIQFEWHQSCSTSCDRHIGNVSSGISKYVTKTGCPPAVLCSQSFVKTWQLESTVISWIQITDERTKYCTAKSEVTVVEYLVSRNVSNKNDSSKS